MTDSNMEYAIKAIIRQRDEALSQNINLSIKIEQLLQEIKDLKTTQEKKRPE